MERGDGNNLPVHVRIWVDWVTWSKIPLAMTRAPLSGNFSQRTKARLPAKARARG